MSEPPQAGTRADTKRSSPFVRLRELTNTTEEYAALQVPLLPGLAATAAGIWTLLAIGSRLVLGAWGWLPCSLTPGVLALLGLAGSRHYRRHGEVVRSNAATMRRRSWSAAFARLAVAVLPIACLWPVATWAAGRGAPGWIGFTVAACSAAAFAFVVGRRRRVESESLLFLVILGAAAEPGQEKLSLYTLRGLVGGLLLLAGIDQHRRFRALERRLEGLRTGAVGTP